MPYLIVFAQHFLLGIVVYYQKNILNLPNTKIQVL